jgi:glycine dehydrogenase subunit 1
MNRYIPNTLSQQREMLATIGVASIEDLLTRIPAKARLGRPLDLPPALAEAELVRHMRALAAQNADAERYACFLGGGHYDHHIPVVINHLISRSEFFTAYTPYQPEASQGTLRTIYEYQTMIAELTGMDVANASLYDGASAAAEAALMAHSVTGRDQLVVSGAVHPLYRRVIATYCSGPRLRIREAPWENGTTSVDQLKRLLTEKIAGVVVQSPNFFGSLEELEEIAGLAHAKGALLIVVVSDAVSLGLLRSPGSCGADIVVGEGQGLGVPMSFGGPNLGLFAAKQELVRRVPGRLVGATVDKDGQRGFVLTLQTREQHIRREKASSNICTNVALCALMATIYLAIMGKHGFRKVGELCFEKAHYAAEKLAEVPGVSLAFSAPFFNEFVLRLSKSPDRVVKALAKQKILAGIPLKSYDRRLKDSLLVAVTENRTREEIDAFAHHLAEIVK